MLYFCCYRIISGSQLHCLFCFVFLLGSSSPQNMALLDQNMALGLKTQHSCFLTFSGCIFCKEGRDSIRVTRGKNSSNLETYLSLTLDLAAQKTKTKTQCLQPVNKGLDSLNSLRIRDWIMS